MADDDDEKEQAFDIGPEPAAPLPRSLDDELSALMPHLEGLGQMATEDYISSQKQLTMFQTKLGLKFNRRFYDEIVNREIAAQERATDAARTGALSWAGQYGWQARETARATNPEWAASMDKLGGLIGQVGQRSPISTTLDTRAMGYLETGGPSTAFTKLLDQQALSELKLGGALTPEQERMAQQGARTAYASRGMAMGDSAALAEVLNRESMSNARLRERQGIAAGREAGALGRLQYGEQFAAGREAAGLQEEAMDRAFIGSTAQLTEAMDPVAKYLGMPSRQVSGATSTLGFTQAQPGVNTQSIMGAGLAYGSDVYNTNTNMAASMYNSWQNNSAALQGAQMQSEAQIASAQATAGAYGSSGGSGIAGAALGAVGSAASAAVSAAFCWVAREVFGGEDKRWRTFRVWMVLEAPRELKELYAKHGKAIARQIRNLPHLKAALRQIMEPLAV